MNFALSIRNKTSRCVLAKYALHSVVVDVDNATIGAFIDIVVAFDIQPLHPVSEQRLRIL
jgi:hypothetical protein